MLAVAAVYTQSTLCSLGSTVASSAELAGEEVPALFTIGRDGAVFYWMYEGPAPSTDPQGQSQGYPHVPGKHRKRKAPDADPDQPAEATESATPEVAPKLTQQLLMMTAATAAAAWTKRRVQLECQMGVGRKATLLTSKGKPAPVAGSMQSSSRPHRLQASFKHLRHVLQPIKTSWNPFTDDITTLCCIYTAACPSTVLLSLACLQPKRVLPAAYAAGWL